MPDFSVENEQRAKGFGIICGVDEAGRGPLSGPVVAAACILPEEAITWGLNDSKKLSPKKRDLLFDKITKSSIAYGIGYATPEEIDSMNILNATFTAMRRAIDALVVKPELALIDGNLVRGFDLPAIPVIHGDAISCSIAAASILAKVTRDRICAEDALKYPEYDFASNKGYGTKAHMDALREHGPCPIHRRSFLKFLDT